MTKKEIIAQLESLRDNSADFAKDPDADEVWSIEALDIVLEIIKELPCKVGDVVYQTDGCRVYQSTIKKLIFETEGIAFDASAIGTSIYLTREEAEERIK